MSRPAPDSVSDTRAAAEAAIRALATTPTPEAFAALLELSSLTGVALGDSARLLAATSSWSTVGEASGTTKQAAWARWHG
ncbi:hypothetical protein GCM10028781_00930 [Nostocoides australiense]